jgi:aldose sugar dehydrogenase
VIVRLNDDGTAPSDNPFFAAGAAVGGNVGANIQKLFAYGIRNSFGMAVDPVSGDLWEQENGDDSFSELNRVEPGMNSG